MHGMNNFKMVTDVKAHAHLLQCGRYRQHSDFISFYSNGNHLPEVCKQYDVPFLSATFLELHKV